MKSLDTYVQNTSVVVLISLGLTESGPPNTDNQLEQVAYIFQSLIHAFSENEFSFVIYLNSETYCAVTAAFKCSQGRCFRHLYNLTVNLKNIVLQTYKISQNRSFLRMK